MVNSLKKRGQKFVRKFSKASVKASADGKEHLKENLIGRISHARNVRLLIFEWILLVLALVMVATIQAFWFGGSYAEDVFVDGGSYTEATIGRVSSMNPLFATTSSEKVLSRLMFATLIKVDYSGNPGPGLAKSISYSEDGRIWTIKLREGLVWSDGEPITNEDVMFTVSLIKNPIVNSIYDYSLEGVKVSENENGEIVFELSSAYADFATALEFPIVPKHKLKDATLKTLVEDEFSNAPVTSGAFNLNALQISASDDSETIYLSANPNYYLGKPMLSSFAVRTFGDKESLISAVNAGSVTATAELSGLDADKITSGALEKRNTNINAGVFMFFNLNNAYTKDRDFRAAIRQGINISELMAEAANASELSYPLIDSQIRLSNYPQIPAEDFEAAKVKIGEMTGGNAVQLNIATVNSGYLPRVAEKLKEELKALGLEANVTLYEENQDFVTNVVSRRNYDILLYEVELGADPDPLPYYHSSQATAAGLNLSNYRNALVDDLLVAGRATLDTALRAKKYETFLEHWVSDVPAIGLYQANLTYIYNKNVRAYGDEVHLVTALDRFGDVDTWAAVKGTKNKTP